MTDYTKLVEALRCKRDDCEGCGLAFFDKDEGWMCRYAIKDDDAADAIEALQAQLPKRGEIVRCKECIHFTQGGWCDREFDWFPVDENDFCSMAEKMEVQDGANRGF